jgi:hypothetical protein
MNETMQYRPEKRERMMKPVLGAAAVMAALATLGLTVIGPASLPQADPAGVKVIEVAIVPGAIEVVGKRTKTGHVDSPYLPATYKPQT